MSFERDLPKLPFHYEVKTALEHFCSHLINKQTEYLSYWRSLLSALQLLKIMIQPQSHPVYWDELCNTLGPFLAVLNSLATRKFHPSTASDNGDQHSNLFSVSITEVLFLIGKAKEMW